MLLDNFGKINRKDPFGLGLESKKSPVKRRPIDKSTRDAVWLKYMGKKAEGKCYCCKIRPIHFTDFQVGHNKAVAKGGKDNISNLRPICAPCNRGMKTMSIEQYKKKYFGEETKSTTKTSKKVKPKRKSKSKDPFDFSEFKPPKIKLF